MIVPGLFLAIYITVSVPGIDLETETDMSDLDGPALVMGAILAAVVLIIHSLSYGLKK
jgi:hypothetical protein